MDAKTKMDEHTAQLIELAEAIKTACIQKQNSECNWADVGSAGSAISHAVHAAVAVGAMGENKAREILGEF